MTDDTIRCRCGRTMTLDETTIVLDDHGIYAGRWCSYECADRHMNLHYSAQDAAEGGERIDDDY